MSRPPAPPSPCPGPRYISFSSDCLHYSRRHASHELIVLKILKPSAAVEPSTPGHCLEAEEEEEGAGE